jgi:hypothetical protein
MAGPKNTASLRVDSVDECYQVLALLAGARGIMSELEDNAVPEADAMVNIDRLVGEAMDRIRKVAEQEGATNG